MGKDGEELFWFERVYRAFRLPPLVGMVVFGFVPIIVLMPAGYAIAGVWSQMISSGILFAIPVLLVVVVAAQLASTYARSVMNGWKSHSDGLLADGEKVDLRELYRLRGFIATYVILLTFVQTVFVFFVLPQTNSILQNMITSLPFIYWNIYLQTFLWVFAYSMYKIYRTGRRPMNLRSFTEDRSLGLRPFGRVSLQLTGVYFVFLALILIAQVSSAGIQAGGTAIFAVLTVLGLGLFLVPQLSLHSKLLRAKQEAFSWITPQYVELMEVVRRNGVKNTDERVLAQLAGVENIRRDIAQIHTWPFDVGIVARLSAIILSVIAILLSAEIRNVLRI